MVENWEVIALTEDGRLTGPENMARDEALLRAAEAGMPGARVYGWDGTWVSLGRFQRPEEVLRVPATPHVVRPTGGRAVLHGHDVTVAIAMPHGLRVGGNSRDVKAVYRTLIRPLVTALNACGLPAALAETTRYVGRGRESADCFAFNSPNDVVDRRTGCKVCGCALRVTHSGALLQASVPYLSPSIDAPELIVGGKPSYVQAWNGPALAQTLREALHNDQK